MDRDGVGGCLGAGETLSGVCCCCCCAREDLQSVFGSGVHEWDDLLERVFISDGDCNISGHVPAKRALPAIAPRVVIPIRL